MSTTADGLGWGLPGSAKRRQKKEAAEAERAEKNTFQTFYLKIVQKIPWRHVIMFALALSVACTAMSLVQGIQFSLVLSEGESTSRVIFGVAIISIMITASAVAMHLIGLYWSAREFGKVTALVIVMLFGEAISLITSMFMFNTEAFSVVAKQTEASPAAQRQGRLADIQMKAAEDGLAALGEANKNYVTATANAANVYNGILGEAKTNIDKSTDGSLHSPVQKSFDLVFGKIGFSQFMWAAIKAAFLTLYPIVIAIVVRTMGARRKVVIEVEDKDMKRGPDEVLPGKT